MKWHATSTRVVHPFPKILIGPALRLILSLIFTNLIHSYLPSHTNTLICHLTHLQVYLKQHKLVHFYIKTGQGSLFILQDINWIFPST